MTASGWTFPEERGPDLVNALASSELVELSFNSNSCSPAFYDALGRSLTERAGSPLETLHIMNFYQGAARGAVYTESLESLFTPNWELKCLHLDLDSMAWSDDFETSFSSYITSNKFLQRLVLYNCHQFDHGHQMSTGHVLKAFKNNQATGNLDTLDIVIKENQPTDLRWVSPLKKHVASNLNRQRRLSGPLFQNACKMKRAASQQYILLKTLRSVDDSARFSFLSANVWNCRGLLLDVMDFAQSPSAEKHMDA